MTEFVEVAEKSEENAVLLLDAAEALGLDADVVRTTSDTFLVPREVAEHAGLDPVDDELDFSTKKDAEEYADANDLDVDKSLKKDDYIAAVREAAQVQGA